MRVSENTSRNSVGEALRRTRSKLEDLQIKNATQKRLTLPSEDPSSNARIMDIRTQSKVHAQFENNANMAKHRLTSTDAALNELYDVFVRAKEITINQSSSASANEDSRLGVAQEVSALYKQLVSIANRQAGKHHLFGGYKTLEAPYTPDGKFWGDNGEIPIEIQKDVFVAMNLPGEMVFDVRKYTPQDRPRASENTEKSNPLQQSKDLNQSREPASADPKTPADQTAPSNTAAPKATTDQTTTDKSQNVPPIEKQSATPRETINAFQELDTLRVALLTNDTITIRDSLDRVDDIINHVISMRTKISSRINAIDAALSQTSKTDIANAELLTKLEDADYAELWANMAKEETVLRSSLQAAQKLIQPSLLDFMK